MTETISPDPTDNLAPTSLLSHCITCKASCCKNDRVIVTQIGYKNIIDAGYPDYFHKVALPSADFYVLDHKFNQDGSERETGACPYLLQDNRCSIEDVKPDTCKAFPMVRQHNVFNTKIIINPDCPAAKIAEKLPSFTDEAVEISRKIVRELPMHLCIDIINAHKTNLHRKQYTAQ